MSTELRRQLESLHHELGRTNRIDDESRDLLVAVLNDISRLLDPSQPTSPPPAPASEHTLTERLDEVAVKFEAEHPTLGTAIRRVVDTLAKAGI